MSCLRYFDVLGIGGGVEVMDENVLRERRSRDSHKGHNGYHVDMQQCPERTKGSEKTFGRTPDGTGKPDLQ